ncbi:polycystic kidney disease 2-like 2 protein isoform X2 [Centruroides sculpturatus]|uniref:polycystic kidney disease 2-like 2 protein isoform X2 n=1 Tax=Centruroides sculpturatus TaxID=218467 RepID=UPI000C6CB528|nr:polycystic kidney disease 2-like 2 protein isoform X2 [Centruroides sculpturatus]
MSKNKTVEIQLNSNNEFVQQTENLSSESKNLMHSNYGKDFFLYLTFLVTICIISYSMINPTNYYLNSALEKIFIRSQLDDEDDRDFTETKTIRDFWKFLEHVLINNLYWESWYNGEPLENNEGIYYTTQLLGTPRLRQLRVKNDSCKIHEEFKTRVKECFSPYSLSAEDTKPFGLMNGTAWTFYRDSNMLNYHYKGEVGEYYSGGFYIDLGITKKEAHQTVLFLKQNKWIDRSTRVIFLDFSLYNSNVNLFCLIKLIWELPNTGGILTSWKIRSMKFLRYLSPWDNVILAVEYIFCFFTLVNFLIMLQQVINF